MPASSRAAPRSLPASALRLLSRPAPFSPRSALATPLSFACPAICGGQPASLGPTSPFICAQARAWAIKVSRSPALGGLGAPVAADGLRVIGMRVVSLTPLVQLAVQVYDPCLSGPPACSSLFPTAVRKVR